MRRTLLAAPLLLVLAAASWGVASTAWGKANGGRRAGSSGGDLTQGLDRTRLFAALTCPAPSPAQCADPVYAASFCGKYFRQRQGQGLTSGCESVCGLDSLGESECTSQAFFSSLCGHLDRQRATIPWAHDDLANHPSRCLRYAQARGESNQSGGGSAFPELPPPRPVIVPPTVDNNPALGNLPPAGERTQASFAAYDRSLVAEGFTGTFRGMRIAETVAYCNPVSAVERLAVETRRQIWTQNGARVGSCREYVYEKYYDFSLFQDRIAQECNDYRNIFDVAYAPAVGGQIPASAIGTKGLAGVPLAQRDGTPLALQPSFPTGPQPKNAFFALKVASDAKRQQALSAWQIDPIYPHPSSLFLDGLVLIDDDLHQRLSVGQAVYTHEETWQWHLGMSNGLASYLDEELYAFDPVKERFEALLFDRGELTRAYIAAWRRANQQIVTNAPEYQAFPNPIEQVFDPAIFGDPIGAGLQRQHDRALEQQVARGTGTPALGADFATTFSNLATPFDLSAPNAMAYQGSYPTAGTVSAGAGQALIGRLGRSASGGGTYVPLATNPRFFTVGCENYTDQAPLAAYLSCLVRRITEVDAQIEAALVHARDIGCLDVGPGFNPCDWSPKLFAQHLEDPYSELREPDYLRCVDYTADDFGPLAAFDFEYDPGPPPVVTSVDGALCADAQGNPADYRSSPTGLERYFACFDQWQKDVLNYISQQLGGASVIDPRTGQARIGKSDSDAEAIRDVGASDYSDWFGIWTDREGSWALRGIPDDKTNPEFCAMDPYVYGQFAVRGKFLGIGFDLFNAEGRITTEPEMESFALLDVVGNLIIDESAQLSFDTPDGIAEELAKRQTFFEAGATVVIVYIPVSVKGGISGKIGAEVNFGLGVPAGASGGCQDGTFGMSFSLAPLAGVEGFASVSIDAYIIEVGAKITLTIIELRFPFTISLALTGLTSSSFPDAQLELSTRLDMVLELLGGRFSVFLELCFILCETWEADIFKWDGLRFSTNLFETTLKFKLGAVIAFLDANS